MKRKMERFGGGGEAHRSSMMPRLMLQKL